MLTKESHELIQSFLGNSDIKSLLKNSNSIIFDIKGTYKEKFERL